MCNTAVTCRCKTSVSSMFHPLLIYYAQYLPAPRGTLSTKESPTASPRKAGNLPALFQTPLRSFLLSPQQRPTQMISRQRTAPRPSRPHPGSTEQVTTSAPSASGGPQNSRAWRTRVISLRKKPHICTPRSAVSKPCHTRCARRSSPSYRGSPL